MAGGRSRRALEMRAVERLLKRRHYAREDELMPGECLEYVCTRCQKPRSECKCAPVQCRGPECTTPVWWCRTPNGKFIAVELDGTAHWANCANAESFRGRK